MDQPAQILFRIATKKGTEFLLTCEVLRITRATTGMEILITREAVESVLSVAESIMRKIEPVILYFLVTYTK